MSTSNKQTLISVIVLNWNGKKFVKPFFESIKSQNLKDIQIEVLFVDNASSDDSVAYFQQNYATDHFRLVQNDGNYGYAKGNNLGIVQAKGEYILVCNNDLILDDNVIQELWKVAKTQKADLVVPKLLFLNRPGYINNAGSLLSPDSNWPIFEVGANEKDQGQYDEVREITAFCGACVLFRRDFLETVGLYDNQFFMYFEDGDLSWRGQKAGKKYYYAPKAIANHFHTGSSKEGSPLFNHFVYRNRLLILTKNARLRVIASGWKVTLRERFVRQLKNLIKALLGRYPLRQAVTELLRSAYMMLTAALLTPYCLLKRYKLISEAKI